MAPAMSLVLSTTALWSFTAECSLLSPDLLRSDVLRPWLYGFRCVTCRLSPKSPSLIIPHYPSPFSTVSRRLEDPEARLRLIFDMVVASPPPKPDPQIRSSSGETHVQLLLFQRAHRKSEPPSLSPSRCVPPGRTLVPPFIDPPSPRRSSRSHHRLLLIPRSSNVTLGFHCLGQWMGCLLGQKLMVVLLGRKSRVCFLGLIPTLRQLHSTYRSLYCFISVDGSRSHLIKIRPSLQLQQVCLLVRCLSHHQRPSPILPGSIVVKTVLLGADARIVVQDGSCSAFVDGLTLEALFPPPCGFGKYFRFQDVSLETNEASVLSAFNLDLETNKMSPVADVCTLVWLSL